jgi:hypothetical protein
VRQQAGHGLQRINCSVGTARNIQDQCPTSNATNTSAQGGKWSLLEALAAHPFGDAVQQTIANSYRSFRSDIPGGNTSTSCRYDEVDFSREADQEILNLDLIVRHDFFSRNGEAQVLKRSNEGGARLIFLIPAGA